MTANKYTKAARRLPLDMRDYRAPEGIAMRIWRKSESARYFWTPALFCALLFCALLLANFISWRV